ncbi:MAG: CCA tRNA nucleotidyltransferase [Candidatus Methanoperedens sp.]|nr:CCA tRNA nucleotidyltransferase [Candidatus Methanoperedens sp.]
MIAINKICASILSRIKPGEAEKVRLASLAESIIARVNSTAQQEGISASAQLVGSAARGTWISGEHDLDIFIMFPPSLEREELEEKGLYVARKVSQDAQSFEERYAEHPYIHAVVDGFEVDLVPAFNVERASEIKSAVDRTPFHNIYVASMIKGLEDEVLLLKQFMKGTGVYGSELKTHGFSGYLVELLVIQYGSFMKVLEASRDWKPGITIDIEEHGTASHNDPMVVVDPTDPQRNVAAALSLDNLCIFIDKACEFLENPDEAYFTRKVPEPLSDDEFRKILAARRTSLIAIELEAPDVVEDVLFPQLHKLEYSVNEMFERYEFCVYNSSVWASDKKAIVLFELETARLPLVRKHGGPFVWSKEHALAFKSKYKDSNTFSNVFIRNGKYMVEIPRKYHEAPKLVDSEILNCSLGKHLALSIKKELHALEDEKILDVKDEEFRKFLRRFFEK